MLTNEFHGRGRIGNDELIKRNTGKDGKEGTDVCNFAVAIKRNGDTDKADWIDCTLYGKRVSALVKYAKRGTLIDFKGRIETKQNEYKGMKIKNTVVIIDEFELLGAFDYKSAKAGKKKNTEEENSVNSEMPVNDETYDEMMSQLEKEISQDISSEDIQF